MEVVRDVRSGRLLGTWGITVLCGSFLVLLLTDLMRFGLSGKLAFDIEFYLSFATVSLLVSLPLWILIFIYFFVNKRKSGAPTIRRTLHVIHGVGSLTVICVLIALDADLSPLILSAGSVYPLMAHVLLQYWV